MDNDLVKVRSPLRATGSPRLLSMQKDFESPKVVENDIVNCKPSTPVTNINHPPTPKSSQKYSYARFVS